MPCKTTQQDPRSAHQMDINNDGRVTDEEMTRYGKLLRSLAFSERDDESLPVVSGASPLSDHTRRRQGVRRSRRARQTADGEAGVFQLGSSGGRVDVGTGRFEETASKCKQVASWKSEVSRHAVHTQRATHTTRPLCSRTHPFEPNLAAATSPHMQTTTPP